MLKHQINSKKFLESIHNLFNLESDKEQVYTCSDLTWNEYESILAALDNDSWCKASYLDGVLKLVSPSKNHEIAKAKIRALLEAYCDYVEIDYFAMGSTTLKQKDFYSGKEPDESYCFNTLKEIPDLAIEIIESSGGLDDLLKYQRLLVKEVWFWQKNNLAVYVNEGDRYVRQTSSYCLPDLDLDLLASFMKQVNTGNLRIFKKQFVSNL
ncbi:MAG: Uma2 family endonuclease [Xenococcaceae cyanobacterium]